MRLQRNHYIIAAFGAVVVLALALFPDWNGVHPADGLTMPLGHAWILSPPAPPENFGGMRVEPSWSYNVFLGIVALVVAAVLIFLGSTKAKPV
jgi:hypothetical protein